MKAKRAAMVDTTLNSLVRLRIFNTSPIDVVNNKCEKLYWEALHVWASITCGKSRRIKQTTANHIKEEVCHA